MGSDWFFWPFSWWFKRVLKKVRIAEWPIGIRLVVSQIIFCNVKSAQKWKSTKKVPKKGDAWPWLISKSNKWGIHFYDNVDQSWPFTSPVCSRKTQNLNTNLISVASRKNSGHFFCNCAIICFALGGLKGNLSFLSRTVNVSRVWPKTFFSQLPTTASQELSIFRIGFFLKTSKVLFKVETTVGCLLCRKSPKHATFIYTEVACCKIVKLLW